MRMFSLIFKLVCTSWQGCWMGRGCRCGYCPLSAPGEWVMSAGTGSAIWVVGAKKQFSLGGLNGTGAWHMEWMDEPVRDDGRNDGIGAVDKEGNGMMIRMRRRRNKAGICFRSEGAAFCSPGLAQALAFVLSFFLLLMVRSLCWQLHVTSHVLYLLRGPSAARPSFSFFSFFFYDK